MPNFLRNSGLFLMLSTAPDAAFFTTSMFKRGRDWTGYSVKGRCQQYLDYLTGSNFSDFAILFTFRVLILAILDFNHKAH